MRIEVSIVERMLRIESRDRTEVHENGWVLFTKRERKEKIVTRNNK